MSNDYYTESLDAPPGQRAKIGDLVAVGRRVEAGFARLPRERELKEGRATYAEATGNGRVYAVALPYPIARYEPGLEVVARMPVANRGPFTLNVDRAGAIAVVTHEGTDPPDNFFAAGAIVTFRYREGGGGVGSRFIAQVGQRGLAGLWGLPYRFEAVRGADSADWPGPGAFRLSGPSPADTGAVMVSNRDREGTALGGYFGSFAQYGDNRGRGHLILTNPLSDDGMVFLVTAVDQHLPAQEGDPDWTNLTVEHVSGDRLPNTTDIYGLQFAPVTLIPSDMARLWAGGREAFEALTARETGRLYAVLE